MALALVGEAVVVVEEAVVELAYNMMADTEEHRMERMTPHMDSLKKKTRDDILTIKSSMMS